MKKFLSNSQSFKGLLVLFFIGLILFVWQLGSTGLIDETPPLFAAAGRAMSETGDWLTPQVNGLPRYDKPPLFYWLMAIGYSLPWQHVWDPFGTWSARLPSSLSSLMLMIFIGDTLMRFPQRGEPFPRRVAVLTGILFALSPLVVLWSRIAVSDALLCSMLGFSLLCYWRRYANPSKQNWWMAWVFLGLAVLVKGPVALILAFLTLLSFGINQKNYLALCQRIRLLPGIFITSIISFPWYILELIFEGRSFLNSFFGYHNFQRFTSVVNSHHEPWWFFGLILIIASLPFTPLLFLSLIRNFSKESRGFSSSYFLANSEDSLLSFASCWLISILAFFTIAATKLPSYWLPATPASALLIGLSLNPSLKNRKTIKILCLTIITLLLLLAIIFWFSPLWIPLINDPEMPSLSKELISSRLVFNSSIFIIFSVIFGLFAIFKDISNFFLWIQAPLVLLHLSFIPPMWKLADKLRQEPLRDVANLMINSKKNNEAFVMVGAAKPSLHFYTNEIVFYEGRSVGALVNLSDRLKFEKRNISSKKSIDNKYSEDTFLMVIDQSTSKRNHWKDLNPILIGDIGIYSVWRLNRLSLDARADHLIKKGIKPNWRSPKPERF